MADVEIQGSEGDSKSEDRSGGVPPENLVPIERANQMAAAARREGDMKAARLEGELQALRETAKPQQARTYNRAELDALVDEGRLTRDQADGILDRQNEERVEQAVDSKVQASLDRQRRVDRQQDELRRYQEAVPEVFQEGTEVREKLKREFRSLVDLGHPDNEVTSLAALRVVLGPPESLKTGRKTVETFQDGGSGGADEEGDRAADNKDGSPKGLSRRERENYARLIDRGVYKDWEAVKKELAFADPKIRERARARA